MSNTIISYVTYVLLLKLNVHYLIASIVGFIISVLNSYYWNNKYVFKKEEGEYRSILRVLLKTFLAYAGTGLVLSNVLLVFWIELLGIPEMLAPIINLIVTIPLNFVLNKFWAYT